MALVATHRQIVYRLLPQRRSTWRLLERTLEDRRQLWNAALEERIDCYRKTGRSLTFFDQCKALTQCRRDDPEVAACPVAIQRGTLRRLDEAYKHFFRRVRNGQTPGFPRFKGRSRFDSISVVSGVKARDGRLRVPGFGPLAIRRKGGNPYPGGKPVSAVLKRVGGRWHAIVCLSVEVEEPADNGRAVGLDRNGGQVADSDGGIFQMPDTARLEARSRRLQRKLSRQRKASRRRERTKRHLARVRRRIANRRKNWHHQVSRRLAAKAGTVAVEGLNVKAMTRSAKGTAAATGTMVAQKGWRQGVLAIRAMGRGSYARTRVDRSGFPVGYLMAEKCVRGFRTGDIVRATVPSGKKRGVHVGRVAVRRTGSFNFQTALGTVQGISHRHCRVVQRGDGYGYHVDTSRMKETATMHGTREPAILPALKDGVSCGMIG